VSSIRQTLGIAAIACAVAMATSTVRAAQIIVVDADNGSWAAYDRSTGGDSTTGLTAGFSSSGLNWAQVFTVLWNGTCPGHTSGAGASATWTVSGYAPGAAVNVYAHWRGQGNASAAAPYSVNGGATVSKDHKGSPAADLVLTDPQPQSQNFDLLGQYTADGAGQVQVVLTHNGFCNVDAVAFETVPSVYALIEDFESHGLAADIDTANGWVEFPSDGAAGGSVIQDPADAGNKAAQLTGATSNEGYILGLGGNAVVGEAGATLFFRYRSTQSMSVYLTDADTLGPPNWWDEDEAGVFNNQPQSGQVIKGHYDSAGSAAISYNIWYNIWVKVDLLANTYDLYMSQDLDPATGGATSVTVETGVAFRGGAGAGDLDHLFIASNNAAAGGLIDDIYIAPGTSFALPDDLQPARGVVFAFK